MNTLTHFNQEIQITVSVDAIAQKLLESMNPENPHSVLIVNTIIGQAIVNERKNDISRIYNALSGFETKVNFHMNQVLYCTDTTYDHKNGVGSNSREIGVCKVIEIEPLKDRGKVKIEFEKFISSGQAEIGKIWVEIYQLREIVESDVVDLEPQEQTGE